MTKNRKLLLYSSVFLMVLFLLIKLLVLLNLVKATHFTRTIEMFCFLIFSPIFYFLVKKETGQVKDDLLKKISDSENFDEPEIINGRKFFNL